MPREMASGVLAKSACDWLEPTCGRLQTLPQGSCVHTWWWGRAAALSSCTRPVHQTGHAADAANSALQRLHPKHQPSRAANAAGIAQPWGAVPEVGEGWMSSRCMAATACSTEAWLWVATISSAWP